MPTVARAAVDKDCLGYVIKAVDAARRSLGAVPKQFAY